MRGLIFLALAATALPVCAAAQTTQTTPAAQPSQTDVLTVWGLRERQIGKAYSASEGVVDFGKFADRPLLRVGELAEVVPGLAATQHSGTGKANQYFLRGFNLDHGTDFSISLDGIPLNQRTSAHGQGYLDINFLIPEIVQRISYQKGVAKADVGDFSAAGSAAFSTFRVLPSSFIQGELGENSWQRIVGGVKFGDAGYISFDLTGDDGPWVRPENLRKRSVFARFNAGNWSFSGGAYRAEWDATDQIPLRAVQSGAIDRLGFIDSSVGGDSDRAWLNASYQNDDGLAGNAYVSRYTLNLISNFTYFLNDPVNGDEFQQAEERTTYGGALTKQFQANGPWTPRLGIDARFDRLDPVGLYQTAKRLRLATVREDRVDQDSVGAFGDIDGNFGRARLNLGLRADAMRVQVRSDDPRNSGTASEAILSPKASLAWAFSDTLESYVSAGRGFHSNDARGATIAFDPATGDPADRVPLLVKATGVETGLRYETKGFSAAAAVFGLDLDSELVYVGDAGATEPSDASRRYGAELTATWAATSWLTLDGAAAYTHARLRGVPKGEDRIPLANDYVVTGGATMNFAKAWTVSLTGRYLGPSPLIEDNSVRSDPSFVVNSRAAWRSGRVTIALEALNLLDGKDNDITYFYASRLPGEPLDGVEDEHFHPVPPRSFRLQARVDF